MVVVVGTITFLSVVIGELVPKQLAIKYADDLAMFVARPMTLLSKICTPVVISFERAARLLLRILGVIDANETPMTQYEIKAIISEGKASGLFEQEENLMLHSVMDLSDIMVEKVMTHRKNIEMIDSSLPVTEIVDLALTSPYTRLPLYQDQPENIVGVLHTKILARQLRGFEADRPTIDLSAAISEAWFIPETTTLLDQLKAFRTRKEHFALVVDEYGSLLGLITREDILEEIVGQMDEGDETDAPSVQANTTNSTIIVDGEKTIRELNREFEWSLPDDDYATIAGLILYESRTLPEVGQSFVFYNFQFDILERHRHQITSIRITRI
jgi:Mg2+/Co2+ transporter CorB